MQQLTTSVHMNGRCVGLKIDSGNKINIEEKEVEELKQSPKNVGKTKIYTFTSGSSKVVIFWPEKISNEELWNLRKKESYDVQFVAEIISGRFTANGCDLE